PYGTLKVSHTNGLSDVAGNGTSLLGVTGSEADLKIALESLSYTPPAILAGTLYLDALLVPGDGEPVSSAGVPITVVHVDWPPTVSMPANPQTVRAGDPLVFSSAAGNAITVDVDHGSAPRR